MFLLWWIAGFLLIANPVQAQEAVHGIAMHGAPHYAADFQYLDYVSPQAKKGGILKQSQIGTFDTLNPFNIKGNKAAGLDGLYDPLMARVWDEPFSLYGLVAEKVIWPEDRSEITYILNPKAKFHDGIAITTADVAYSFEMHKKYGKPVTRQVYGLVKQVDIQSPTRIRFVFGEGYDRETAMILSLMRVVPKHYWKDKDFGATTLDAPLGSGPYKISSVDAGRQITYERVKDYWAKDLPINKYQYNFDTLVFDYYRDETVAFQALKTGDIDLWRESNIRRWVEGYGKDLEKGKFEHGRPEQLNALIFNTRKPVFEDVNVRKALYMAFPYDWINKTLFQGQYKPITSVFANSELAATDNPLDAILAKPERKRLREAADLFKQAGWEVKDGVLMKEDKSFAFELLVNDPNDEKIALTYSRNLEKLGVKVTVRTVDSAQFLGRLNDFSYDMVFYRWINSLSPGNEQAIYWGSKAADAQGTRNYAGVKNVKIDKAIQIMGLAKDRSMLVNAAHILDREVIKNFYIIPLFYKGFDGITYKKNIKHPQTTPVYGPVLEAWWTE
ncbi:MAG: ABC transporter substrate-binding protein [Micavibrio sp.]|nr:ABC transporter substrate-binding protein [Micavibrio sp.]|tara:strand:+ start:1751 stop:3421 length:1671 start_codon:yes stop_codon:yes gene_type:complete